MKRYRDLAGQDEFWRTLLEKKEYRTAPRPLPWTARHLPWMNAVLYHFLTTQDIVNGGLAARRGRYGKLGLAWSCLDMLYAAESRGGRIEISGLGPLSEVAGPVVLVSNHMSSLETYVLPAMILPFADFVFVLKKSLLSYPFMGDLLKGIDSIAVGRQRPREDFEQVMREGCERIAGGVSVLIFPQATRSGTFDFRAFNSMGVKLAVKAGVPVVPIAVCTDFLAKGRILKDYGAVHPEKPIRFRFGPVIRISGNGKAEHEQAADFIAGCLREWGLPVLEGTRSQAADGQYRD